MLRCPSCHIQLTPPKDKKFFDCESCEVPLKRRLEGVRVYSGQFLFLFLLISLVLSGWGTIMAIVLAAAAGLGLWYWIGNFTVVAVQE